MDCEEGGIYRRTWTSSRQLLVRMREAEAGVRAIVALGRAGTVMLYGTRLTVNAAQACEKLSTNLP